MTECGRAYRGGVRVGRGTTLGLPEDWVYSSKHGFVAVRQRLAAPAENDLPGLGLHLEQTGVASTAICAIGVHKWQ